MMQTLASVGDWIAVIGFAIAAGILLFTPSGGNLTLSPYTKWLTIAAFTTRAYVSATKVAFVGPSRLEVFGDYIEVLFPVLAAAAVFSAFSAQQLQDLARSQRAVQASNAMMIGMVDAAPAGILVLDDAGRITFANDSAREVLDLSYEADTGEIMNPGWKVRDPHGDERPDFACLLHDVDHAPVPLQILWPSGWRARLLVSTRPLHDGASLNSGLVATFERPTAS